MSTFEEVLNKYLAKRQPEAGDDALFPFVPPSPPAKSEEVDALERHIGYRLSPQFRDLLSICNGCSTFFRGISLLSTDQMMRGDGEFPATDFYPKENPPAEISGGGFKHCFNIGIPDAFPR